LEQSLAEVALSAAASTPPPPLSAPPSIRELIEERVAQLDQLEAKLRETPYALGRYIEPLDRWLDVTVRLLAERGLPQEGKRLVNVGYMGTGDSLLDGDPRMAAYRMFLVDLLEQSESDPSLLQRTERERVSMARDPRRVVVVHGRNKRARDGIFDLLRHLDLSPVE